MRIVLNNRLTFWIVLALPAIPMTLGWFSGRIDAMDMLHPTGEWAVRWMVLAMMIGPLADIFGPRGWVRWLLARRRWLGFAAFLYAEAHLIFYVIDMATLEDIVAEITEHGIWTGWLAMLLIALPGFTSTDAAMRRLKRGWKRVQQFAYPAALFTALHWGLLEMHWGGVFVHFGPLAVLNLIRLAMIVSRTNRKESIA